MSSVLLGVGLMALLFVIAGITRLKGCNGHCKGCSGSCGHFKEGGPHGAD